MFLLKGNYTVLMSADVRILISWCNSCSSFSTSWPEARPSSWGRPWWVPGFQFNGFCLFFGPLLGPILGYFEDRNRTTDLCKIISNRLRELVPAGRPKLRHELRLPIVYISTHPSTVHRGPVTREPTLGAFCFEYSAKQSLLHWSRWLKTSF